MGDKTGQPLLAMATKEAGAIDWIRRWSSCHRLPSPTSSETRRGMSGTALYDTQAFPALSGLCFRRSPAARAAGPIHCPEPARTTSPRALVVQAMS